jgi:hypothetical protein
MSSAGALLAAISKGRRRRTEGPLTCEAFDERVLQTYILGHIVRGFPCSRATNPSAPTYLVASCVRHVGPLVSHQIYYIYVNNKGIVFRPMRGRASPYFVSHTGSWGLDKPDPAGSGRDA